MRAELARSVADLEMVVLTAKAEMVAAGAAVGGHRQVAQQVVQWR